MSTLYMGHKDFSVALESPTFPREMKVSLLNEVLSQLKLSEGMSSFIGLLLEKNRLKFIDTIRQSYQDLSDELSGIVRARIISAEALGDDQIATICSVLEQQTGKKVIIEALSNAEQLGGLQVEIGGKIYDGTVKTQLKRIADTLKKG